MRHTGEQWALDAGEDTALEWCPTCEEEMAVDWDGCCEGCGSYLEDEDPTPHWAEDVHMEREHERGVR
jgi:hypothetical protein